MDPKALFHFIDAGITPFHVVHQIGSILAERGFVRVHPFRDRFAPDKPLYAEYEDGALIAYAPGSQAKPSGVVVLAAHTDSPTYRVKEHAVRWKSGCLLLPTEAYGSPIDATWLDRPLTVAGRLVTRGGEAALFELPDSVVIPNLALHLNRDANDGIRYNRQDHMRAIAAARLSKEPEDSEVEFFRMIARSSAVPNEEIAEVDAFLAVREHATRIGTGGALFSAPRIDNLAGCYTSLESFLRPTDHAKILLLFSHEEIGSLTGSGAQSDILGRFINRLAASFGWSPEEADAFRAASRVVSNDAAHAMHPNYPEKYDSHYSPLLGAGPALKMSATHRYATTSRTATEFRLACERAGVPMQRQRNRSDIRSGSTVGPITWARSGISTVDVGIGILAMHSAVETASVDDVVGLADALAEYLPLESRG